MDITEKIDAVTRISKTRISLGGIQKPPKSVKIELTTKCVLRCKFCAVHTRDKNQKDADMDLDYFKRIVEDIRMCGVEEIGLFFLGESFMVPDLLVAATEFCKKEMGFPWVFLTSNAAVSDVEAIEGVMAAGLNSLKWSVNSYNEDQFKEITGGSAKLFWKAVDNIQAAYKIRKDNDYKTLLSASSIFYDNIQRDRMRMFLVQHINAFVDKHYWLPLYQMAMYKEKIEQEMGYTPTAGNMGRIDEETMLPNRDSLPCWACFTEGHVRVDGGVSACCFGADSRFDMGHLDGGNFMSQWNSKKFQSIRKAQLRSMKIGPKALLGTPCRVCVAYGGDA